MERCRGERGAVSERRGRRRRGAAATHGDHHLVQRNLYEAVLAHSCARGGRNLAQSVGEEPEEARGVLQRRPVRLPLHCIRFRPIQHVLLRVAALSRASVLLCVPPHRLLAGFLRPAVARRPRRQLGRCLLRRILPRLLGLRPLPPGTFPVVDGLSAHPAQSSRQKSAIASAHLRCRTAAAGEDAVSRPRDGTTLSQSLKPWTRR